MGSERQIVTKKSNFHVAEFIETSSTPRHARAFPFFHFAQFLNILLTPPSCLATFWGKPCELQIYNGGDRYYYRLRKKYADGDRIDSVKEEEAKRGRPRPYLSWIAFPHT
jgi:hypothetical protein